MEEIRLVHAPEDGVLRIDQAAEVLPRRALPEAVGVAAHDAAAAQALLRGDHRRGIERDRHRRVFLEQLEVARRLDQEFGLPGRESVVGPGVMQLTFRRGDGFGPQAIAVGVRAQIAAVTLPVRQILLGIDLPRADVEHEIEAEPLVGGKRVAAAQVGVQVVLHPVVHLGRQMIGLLVGDGSEQAFARIHHASAQRLVHHRQVVFEGDVAGDRSCRSRRHSGRGRRTSRSGSGRAAARHPHRGAGRQDDSRSIPPNDGDAVAVARLELLHGDDRRPRRSACRRCPHRRSGLP